MGFRKSSLLPDTRIIEGDSFRYFSNKKQKLRISNSVTVPKNVKADPLGFFNSLLLQNFKTKIGGPFGVIKNGYKKSHNAEKSLDVGFALYEVLALPVCFVDKVDKVDLFLRTREVNLTNA